VVYRNAGTHTEFLLVGKMALAN